MHRRTVLPAAVDALVLAMFVVLGRESHDIHSGVSWYLTVLWPFLVGWFVVALAVRVYALWPQRWSLLIATWAGGIAVALIVRAVVTQRMTPVAFIIVAYAFIGLATFGWRLAVRGLGLLRGRA
jgi:Protein of unknown function (DUF3054)